MVEFLPAKGKPTTHPPEMLLEKWTVGGLGNSSIFKNLKKAPM
jgi:hypothetical protein